MSLLYFKVPRQEGESVRSEIWTLPHFYEPVHFHEECQLTYILESEGILFIGNQIDRFARDELYLIGKNLPHVFRNDDIYFKEKGKSKARAISIFFSSEILQNIIKEIPESLFMNKLLENSAFGIRLTKDEALKIKKQLVKLVKLTGFSRVMMLLTILNKISLSSSSELLSKKMHIPLAQEHRLKLNKVFEYAMSHYREKITLEEVAALINYSPTAFCRFFKQHTLKTFSQFIIEIRISNACRLLEEGLSNVSEACYSTGHGNISNFHRHFKTMVGTTPLMYKKNIKPSDSDN
jgi:AraC-like DNA-binding protein